MRIIPPQFDDAASFSEGLTWVSMGLKLGYIHKGGKTIMKPQFDRASSFSNRLATVAIDGQLGYIRNSFQ
ncbi:MAG: WG repeat-containing protein [Richelia sp.]|nr:WG repeat-containing protein [Richelia sp.]CDN11825.1 hypothetical protein RintRC_3801 [Richelia intracellularis]